MKALILKTQKNEALELLTHEGLDPKEFLWEERQSGKTLNLQVSALIHRPTGFYFVFDFHKGQHYTVRSPGETSAFDTQFPGSWVYQRGYLIEWINSVKREYEALDLWAAVTSERQFFVAAAESQEGGPFDVQEQEFIRTRVNEIREYLVSTHSLNEHHQEYVERQLDYLVAAAKRQPRRDWLHLAIGVLVSIVIQLGLSSSAASEFFRFASNAFSELFGGTKLLP